MKIYDVAEQFIQEKQDTGLDNASVRRFALYLETFSYVVIAPREKQSNKRGIVLERI